jgi:nucleoside phosphorylase
VLLVIAATDLELGGVSAADTLACGIGPVEAAAATALALARRRPAAVLHVGLAGARRASGIGPPALVIGSEAVYCDARSGLVRSRVVPDARLVEAARRALPTAPVLTIGTSAAVGGSRGCEVEAMEGFAVLRAAELARVPAVEVRAVSNEIEEADRGRWRFEDALGALRAALPSLFAEIRLATSGGLATLE